MEAQARVGLQRAMLATYAIHSRDQVAEAVPAIELPMKKLILLRIAVLFAARVTWLVLEQFKRGPIDAVARTERRCEHEAATRGGPAAELQVLGQDIGRVRPKIGAEVVGHRRARDLGQVLLDLPARVAPCEVRVRLRKAKLREAVHHLRPS